MLVIASRKGEPTSRDEHPERAVVLEVKGNRAVVLTTEGEFRRLTLPGYGYAIGDEVALPAAAGRRTAAAWWRLRPAIRWRPVALAAAVLALALVPVGAFWYQSLPAAELAYVTVDINPSLDLTVDARERVVDAVANNADGQRLLAGLGREGFYRRPLDQVLASVTQLAVDLGYLAPDGEHLVLLAVAPAGSLDSGLKARLEAVQARLQAAVTVRAVLAEARVEAVVETIPVPPAVREEAKKLQLSPGKLGLYVAARQADLDLEPDAVAGNLAQVLQEAGKQAAESLKELARKARELDRTPAAQRDAATRTILDQFEQEIKKSGKDPVGKEPAVWPGERGRGKSTPAAEEAASQVEAEAAAEPRPGPVPASVPAVRPEESRAAPQDPDGAGGPAGRPDKAGPDRGMGPGTAGPPGAETHGEAPDGQGPEEAGGTRTPGEPGGGEAPGGTGETRGGSGEDKTPEGEAPGEPGERDQTGGEPKGGPVRGKAPGPPGVAERGPLHADGEGDPGDEVTRFKVPPARRSR